MFETIIYEANEGIGKITINRPEVLNALNYQVLEEVNEALDLATADENIKVLIITGNGRAFIAGADIATQAVMNPDEALRWGEYGSAIFRKLEQLPIPTIASINGFALGGGCELAMACDIMIASEKAKFGQPETSLGITPGFSGTQRLLRKVGKAKAKELIFTGDMIKADEALSIGLINKVVPHDELENETYAMAAKISKNAPVAIRYAKKTINQGAEVNIDSAIKIENSYFSMCFATEDQKEGMNAFLEKREAVFKNK